MPHALIVLREEDSPKHLMEGARAQALCAPLAATGSRMAGLMSVTPDPGDGAHPSGG
jgi:hypothetical protein